MSNKKAGILFKDTPEQKKKLEEVIAAHKDQPGALMPILQQAQDIYGYLPIEVQTTIAEALDKYTASLLFMHSFRFTPRDSIRFLYAWAQPAMLRARAQFMISCSRCLESAAANVPLTASFRWKHAAV